MLIEDGFNFDGEMSRRFGESNLGQWMFRPDLSFLI